MNKFGKKGALIKTRYAQTYHLSRLKTSNLKKEYVVVFSKSTMFTKTFIGISKLKETNLDVKKSCATYLPSPENIYVGPL